VEDFEAWYRQQHRPLVAALTALSGDPDVARDATDEAFVRALDAWDRVRSFDSPTGWVYRVALNALRRSKRRRAFERQVAHREPRTTADPLPHTEVWDAVRLLPPRQRVAIALRYVADLPEADVAAAMGVTRGTVSSTLVDARARLLEVLGSDESTEATR
jgi:RNA polymerase sigma-70 factor (ECF subfamily)